MPEEGGDNNLTAVKMDERCLSLIQMVWSVLASVPGTVWAGGVCPL